MESLAVITERNRTVTREVRRYLVSAGGLNPFGTPNYRIVWGWTRGQWVAGCWIPRYSDPERHLERFHLERWIHPDFYPSEERWESFAMAEIDGQLVNVLGPYPRHGDYEHLFTFEDPDYVRPSIEICEAAIQRNQRLMARTSGEIQERQEARAADKRHAIESKKDDLVHDAQAAFPLRTWMPVSGPMTATARRSVVLSDLRG